MLVEVLVIFMLVRITNETTHWLLQKNNGIKEVFTWKHWKKVKSKNYFI